MTKLLHRWRGTCYEQRVFADFKETHYSAFVAIQRKGIKDSILRTQCSLLQSARQYCQVFYRGTRGCESAKEGGKKPLPTPHIAGDLDADMSITLYLAYLSPL